jgi:hypothetical protein
MQAKRHSRLLYGALECRKFRQVLIYVPRLIFFFTFNDGRKRIVIGSTRVIGPRFEFNIQAHSLGIKDHSFAGLNSSFENTEVKFWLPQRLAYLIECLCTVLNIYQFLPDDCVSRRDHLSKSFQWICTEQGL